MLIILTRPHEHAGTKHGAGAEVDLPDDAARYLISINAAVEKPQPQTKPRKQEQAK